MAASDGASADAAPSLCSPTSVELLCEGFEDAALASHWVVFESAGALSLDTARAYRGRQSIHSHTNAAAGGEPHAELRSRRGLMMGFTGQAHVRMWAYFASPWAPSFSQLAVFSDQSGGGISTGARNLNMVNNDFTDLDLAESATQPLPLDRWTCLQFEAPSGMSGTTRVFVDGAEVTDVTLTKSSVQPPFDNIYIGIYWANNTAMLPAADAWFDEVIVDDAPTTCAQ